ncbi:MAG: isopeptide-forming domain-containing fimbrial protein [Collinsella sp.]|nr:isopeptide-forming domain-containing fimbrial protein [Collinsella sp.]
MNKKVCSFPILFALLALLIGACAVVFPASAQAAPTSTGSITVGGTVASSYDAYQIFDAHVVDGDNDAKIATDIAWVSDAVRDAALPVLHNAGMPNSQTTAREAAEWLNTDSHLTSALSAQLARSLQSSDAESVALNAGTAADLPCGYWLIVADDDAIAQGEAGTAPIMARVGGRAVTVKPKAATPKVAKHVLEDSTAAWQKAADATVADDLYWRLSATVPAGLTAYDTYAVQFVDTMGAVLTVILKKKAEVPHHNFLLLCSLFLILPEAYYKNY